MDDIAETGFNNTIHEIGNAPSHLTVIIDTDPTQWEKVEHELSLLELIKAVLVYVNAHISLNTANTVAVIAAHNNESRFLYPPHPDDEIKWREKNTNGDTPGQSNNDAKISGNEMYNQFKAIDNMVLENLQRLINAPNSEERTRSSLSGALGLALAFINRLSNEAGRSLIKSKILVISVSNDECFHYISLMNCIFAAQKMRIPIDVCKIGEEATFLQQAADATNGVYMLVKVPKGIIQYLLTAMFVEPSIRSLVNLPTNNDIDFRASCILTKKVVDIGYVCSVCLCIFGSVPNRETCPICDSKFEERALAQLRRKPAVPKMKKKLKKKRKLNEKSPSISSTGSTPMTV